MVIIITINKLADGAKKRKLHYNYFCNFTKIIYVNI